MVLALAAVFECRLEIGDIGIHPRLSAWPIWLVEGLAEYCATPASNRKQKPMWDGLGMINGRQTKGEIVKHTSAAGTSLTLDRTVYDTGLGTHATSFIEYPLAGQFSSLEVTVGIDGSTEGRGSVLFRVFVDGKERASSGIINGFSKPKTLEIDKLEGAKRLILSVTDAEDGNRDDLANWVDGKLWLRDK